MAHTVTFSSKFDLAIKVKKHDRKNVEELLLINGYLFTTWQQCGFEAFYVLKANVNIRQAEMLRQLLKNYKTYE